MSDAWIQRFDEQAREDEEDRRRCLAERADRLTERASLEPWQARMDIDALQPDLAPLPSLAYQGTPPVRRVSGWRLLLRWLVVLGVVIACLVLALAVAVTIFLGVAWALSG